MKGIMPRTKDEMRPALHRRLMGLLVAAMVLMTGMPLVTGLQVQAEESIPLPQRDGRIVVYVSDRAELGLTDAMAPHMDQINYAFALIEDGEATGKHWQGSAQLTRFLKKHSRIDGVMAVGGWGAEGFSDACATEEGRVKLADSILALMDEYGFSGVDIDWEYPGSSAAGIKSRDDDVENWYALLALLRAGLDQREAEQGCGYLLSVALGAGESQLNAVDGKRLDALVDQAVIMAYDLKGFDRMTGHHAGLYPAGDKPESGAYAVNRLISTGLSPEKILLGVPAYGRVWRQVMGGGDGLNVHAATAGNKTMGYDGLTALEDQGYRRFYDEDAQAAWWYDGENFVSGEDSQSLKAKADYLRDNGLKGAAVWAQHHDPEGSMLRELDAALTDHFGGENPATATDAEEEKD